MFLDIVLGTFFAVFTHIFMTTLFMSGVVIAFEYIVKGGDTRYLDNLDLFCTAAINKNMVVMKQWKC